MKIKETLFVICACIGTSSASYGQLIITSFVDSDQTGTPRVFEFFVTQTFSSGDLSNWSLRKSTDNFASNDESAATTPFDTMFGTVGDFIYLEGDVGDLNTMTGGSITTAFASASGIANAPSDRHFILRDGTGTTVDAVDRVNGAGLDFGIYRTSDSSGPDGSTFVSGNWTSFDTDGLEGSAIVSLVNSNFGSYAVPEPNTYALLSGICALGFVMLRRRNQ